ncbi:MAG: hypothetical protein JO123_00995 [Ktedonobacteraceae bacterium]|nr:hypothetical protein [Ktedonobacteraceae bacterium]
MGLQFLRGNPQAPKGHAIFVALSADDSRAVFCTYCVVPPIPMSLTKYLPPLFAAQLPPEELQEVANISGMPIPPMLEEVFSMQQLETIAERRDDDLCDIGPLSSKDEAERMQMAAFSSQEYAQLYSTYATSFVAIEPAPAEVDELVPLDDLDTDELLLRTMSERQKLTELGKLIGTARYALGGRDRALLQDTDKKMRRIADLLADKYRGKDLVAAALDSHERGTKLAQLYLDRAFKLLDEEYADIPNIERAIRELQNE